MAHKDYLKELNPYILSDGLIHMDKNTDDERRIYNNLIKCIENNESSLLIQDELDLLLSEVAKNYFCKGYKMALQLLDTLKTESVPGEGEEY